MLSRFGVDVNKEIGIYNAWLKEKNPKQDKEPGSTPTISKDQKGLNQILNKLGAKFIT